MDKHTSTCVFCGSAYLVGGMWIEPPVNGIVCAGCVLKYVHESARRDMLLFVTIRNMLSLGGHIDMPMSKATHPSTRITNAVVPQSMIWTGEHDNRLDAFIPCRNPEQIVVRLRYDKEILIVNKPLIIVNGKEQFHWLMDLSQDILVPVEIWKIDDGAERKLAQENNHG
jgi:hypothetical protein